jgi:hypothetical protein
MAAEQAVTVESIEIVTEGSIKFVVLRACARLMVFLTVILCAAISIAATDNAEPDKVPALVRAVGPFTNWYSDQTQLLDLSGKQSSRGWRDVIGGPVFDTSGVGAYWTDDELHLVLVSNFPNKNVESAGRHVAPADLALDLDGDGVLETAIVLSDVRSTGDRGLVRSPGILQGQMYRVSRWLYPSDILRHTYGHGWRWDGPGADEPLAQSAVPVWMAEGQLRTDFAATVEWRDDPRGHGFLIFVTIRSLKGDGPPLRLPMVWGTAVCANDVIFSKISRFDDMVQTDGRIAQPTPADWMDDGIGTDRGVASRGIPRWDLPYRSVFQSGGGYGGVALVGSGSGGNPTDIYPGGEGPSGGGNSGDHSANGGATGNGSAESGTPGDNSGSNGSTGGGAGNDGSHPNDMLGSGGQNQGSESVGSDGAGPTGPMTPLGPTQGGSDGGQSGGGPVGGSPDLGGGDVLTLFPSDPGGFGGETGGFGSDPNPQAVSEPGYMAAAAMAAIALLIAFKRRRDK